MLLERLEDFYPLDGSIGQWINPMVLTICIIDLIKSTFWTHFSDKVNDIQLGFC